MSETAGTGSLVPSNASCSPTRLVVDCDPGVDDAIALAVLADAAHRGVVELDAVTTVGGNVDSARTAHNAVHVLDRLGLDRVPVYSGPAGAIGPPEELVDNGAFHGVGGLGSIDVSNHPDRSVPADPDRLAERYADAAGAGAAFLATGPLTNLARAIRARPELVASIGRLVVMGGAFGNPPGNISDTAEFNFHCDAQAAHEVLTSGVPITLVPLDVTQQVLLRPSDLSAIPDRGPGGLIKALFDWRFADPDGVTSSPAASCTTPSPRPSRSTRNW